MQADAPSKKRHNQLKFEKKDVCNHHTQKLPHEHAATHHHQLYRIDSAGTSIAKQCEIRLAAASAAASASCDA
jgi:hypothetical protein